MEEVGNDGKIIPARPITAAIKSSLSKIEGSSSSSTWVNRRLWWNGKSAAHTLVVEKSDSDRSLARCHRRGVDEAS